MQSHILLECFEMDNGGGKQSRTEHEQARCDAHKANSNVVHSVHSKHAKVTPHTLTPLKLPPLTHTNIHSHKHNTQRPEPVVSLQ